MAILCHQRIKAYSETFLKVLNVSVFQNRVTQLECVCAVHECVRTIDDILIACAEIKHLLRAIIVLLKVCQS